MFHRLPHALAAVAVTGLALAACASPSAAPTATTEPTVPVAAPHWDYNEHGGAIGWGDLAGDFGTCSTGLSQSPIDLPAALPAATDSIEISTEVTEAEEADSGHASQVNVDDDGSVVHYNGLDYELLQIHAHTPSEHTIGGVATDVEFHLVHSTDDGQLLVLGVLVNIGEANAAWQGFLDTATGEDGTTSDIEVSTLLPASLQHWSYSGSLTTPPCTEDVQWIVFSTPIQVSTDQVAELVDVHGHNSRPVQSLGERAIGSGDGILTAPTD